MKLLVVCCLALLVPTLLAEPDSGPCSFAHYLTQRPRWESRISLNRRRTEIYWKFHETSLEIVNLTSKNGESQQFQCHSEMPGQKYIISRDAEGQKLYQCVRFILRSNQVLQVEDSPVVDENSFDANSLCADHSMVLDPWPLVWPGATDTYHACPLTGGYDFYLSDPKNSEEMCKLAHLKPRMESECMAGEGMLIDFRTFECRGRVEMEVKQTLYCLGTWEDKEYTYSVVTDNDDLWPKLWLLRFSTKRVESFSARLYNDIVTYSTSTISENYFEFHFQQALYPSLCENEAYSCTDCEGSNKFYCQKTCHRCDDLWDVGFCEFDLGSQGEWIEVSHLGVRDVSVANTRLYSDALFPLECFNLRTDVWYDNRNYKTLVMLNKNGCKPRYSCVEFKRVSSAVLFYRISQSLVWPQKLQLTAQEICSEEQFRDDPKPLRGEFRSRNLKPLIKKTLTKQPLTTADCGLQGKFQLMATLTRGRKNCSAVLDACETGDALNFHMDSQCTGSVVLERHRCLASYSEDGTRMVITNRHTDVSEYYCWVFYKEEWDSVYRVYLLYASDCHKDIGQQIRYYGYTGHLAEFQLTSGVGFLGSHPCHHDVTLQEIYPSTITTLEWSTGTTRTISPVSVFSQYRTTSHAPRSSLFSTAASHYTPQHHFTTTSASEPPSRLPNTSKAPTPSSPHNTYAEFMSTVIGPQNTLTPSSVEKPTTRFVQPESTAKSFYSPGKNDEPYWTKRPQNGGSGANNLKPIAEAVRSGVGMAKCDSVMISLFASLVVLSLLHK